MTPETKQYSNIAGYSYVTILSCLMVLVVVVVVIVITFKRLLLRRYDREFLGARSIFNFEFQFRSWEAPG